MVRYSGGWPPVCQGWARCAVQKDSGDDPDVTNGVYVYATVSTAESGMTIDGGEGVGRVTKPGLDQPVGAAAINATPRRMIEAGLRDAAASSGYGGGLSAVISIPAGVELAGRTFNPRLGIVGGISVIGTTGIVEPMSEAALTETIRAELSLRRAAGKRYALFTPGNYGEAFLHAETKLSEDAVIQCSNFIGEALDMARDMGFAGALLVGHLGKLVKLAGNMLNTHSRYGDCRLELLCAHAARFGLPKEAAVAILDAATVDEGLRILTEAGIMRPTVQSLLNAADGHVKKRAGIETGLVTFTNTYGLLARTDNADALLARLEEEQA